MSDKYFYIPALDYITNRSLYGSLIENPTVRNSLYGKLDPMPVSSNNNIAIFI